MKIARRVGLQNSISKNSALNPSDSDEEVDSDGVDINDVYEYEEGLPEEESKKNRRFDSVENYEYELPEDFEDEDIASDDGSADDKDNEKHSRMLEEITGLPADAFEGKKKKNDIVVSEAYPESEYNPSRDILDGNNRISIQDLVGPLHGKPGFSKLRRDVNRMERKSMSLYAPLPRPDQERLEREAAYEFTKKDITKWEPLVKRNREAPTIYFDDDTDVRFSTVGAIASEFEPRTDFEKKIASLVNDKDIVEAHRKDGARLLELNEISAEEVIDRQNRQAKFRSILYHHEKKAKRIKKIKSKAYHRSHKKDTLKAPAGTIELDEDAGKELQRQLFFKRAEERFTLKHKGSNWSKRMQKLRLDTRDEGIRAAIHEQYQQHALLTRKINSMKESSGESSSDDSDDTLTDSDDDGSSSLLRKAKKKTLEVLERDEELPTSGVMSLPFMVRGLKKREAAVHDEARLAIQEYERALKQVEDKDEEESEGKPISSGRMVFGRSKTEAVVSDKKRESNNYYGNNDSEEDQDQIEDHEVRVDQKNYCKNHVDFDHNMFREESEISPDDLLKTFKDIVKDPGPNTSYDVAIFASKSCKKTNNSSKDEQTGFRDGIVREAAEANEPGLDDHDMEEEHVDSDTDSGGQMVDGILSSGPRSSYELPSQEELLRRAFAGDDVEGDFEKDKEEVLNEENPEPEKPVLLPGWGQWTDIQKKKGLPSWILEEHDSAKKKREEALKKRRDAYMEHVIISEKLDKKAEKLHSKTLPYPYTSKEVFEQSIRMPIGPEFNPVTAVGALNRPEVVKKTGVMIKPIKFEEVNSHDNLEGQKKKKQKLHKSSGKSNRKAKARKVG